MEFIGTKSRNSVKKNNVKLKKMISRCEIFKLS